MYLSVHVLMKCFMVLNSFCYRNRGLIKNRTDSFAGFLYGGNLNKRNLLRVIEALPSEGICELMCHPGLDGENDKYSHWNYHWEDELNALIDADISGLIKNKGIQLISYQSLSMPIEEIAS